MEKKERITTFLSRKIAFANFAFSVLVVILHAYCISRFSFSEGSANPVDKLAIGFQDIWSQDLTRCAIPTFFAISGYLFFIKADTVQDIWKNMKKRVLTLFVPFILWNIIYFALGYFIDFYPEGVSFFEYLNVQPGIIGWLDKILHIVFLFQYNAVGWYLFVLMGFVCLTPILHYTLKNKYVALLCLLAFLVIGFFEPIPLMRGKNYTMFFFYLGAFVSKHLNNFINRRRTYKELIPFMLLFVASQVIVVIFGFYTDMEGNIPRFLFEIMICVSIWFLLDIIPVGNPKSYFKFSFAIYLTHPLILSAFKLLITYTPLGQMGGAVATLYYIVLWALGTVIPIWLFMLIKKLSPKACTCLTGGR